MPRRTPIRTGVGLQTTTRTKAGRASTFPIERGEYHIWRGYFRAALTGITAAQRTVPNPEAIVRWSVQVADRAYQECRRRRKTMAIPSHEARE